MNEILHAYTAGLIDGEGTVGLQTHGKGEFKSPYVSVTSTTIEFVEYLRIHYGGVICKQKTYQAHHKQSYSWRLQYNKVFDFLNLILPYLREPDKIRRANLILTEYKSVTKRNGKYSDQDKLMKLDFESRFFS